MKAEPVPRSVLFAMLDQQLAKGGRNLCWVALIALLYGIGARISEVLPMRRRDLIDRDSNIRSSVRRIKLKTRGREEFITRTLNEDLVRYIEPWLEYQRANFGAGADDYVFSLRWSGKPVDRKYAWSKFKAIAKESHLSENFATHSPRKTFAMVMYQAWLARIGDPFAAANKVQKLFGHRSIDTTCHYLGINNEDPESSIPELALTEHDASEFRVRKKQDKIY